MDLEEGQSVIALLVEDDDTQSVLTATANGFGKRTSIEEHTLQARGGKGLIAIRQTDIKGKVISATLVRPDDEIMLITDKGVLVRTRVSEVREMARTTQGYKLIALDAGATLTGLQRIVENDVNATDSNTDTDTPTGDDDESPSTESL